MNTCQRVTKQAVYCRLCWGGRGSGFVPVYLVNPGPLPGVGRQYVSNIYLLIKTNECACCQCCILKTIDFLPLSLPSTILFCTLERKYSYSCIFFKSAQLHLPQFSFFPSLSWTFMICFTAKLQYLQ